MRFFTVLLDPEGRGIPEVARRPYESLARSRGLDLRWEPTGDVCVIVCGDETCGDPLVASVGTCVAAGTVRLDNRIEVEQWSGNLRGQLSDLELVLHNVARYGTKYVPRFLGDFAFVVWHAHTRRAVVACDALAVKKLYYAQRDGRFAFSSRAEALALENPYELQYLAELIATGNPSPQITVYAGVNPVPAGTMGVLERGRFTLQQFWAPDIVEPEPAWVKSGAEAAETCRHLLAESVRLRLAGNGDTWAQLSGGMDSSAVVSVAQWLVERGVVADGLAGTVTYVDRQSTGADEREYSDAVVARWRLRNEMIVDPPFWHDDRYAPPRPDLPGFTLPFYPRESRLCEIVRAAGGRVLLTGMGGDELFTGTMLFFADWVASGRLWPAVREMGRRAALGRVSFWELAFRNALLPLLPRSVQHRVARDEGQMPSWMQTPVIRRYGLSGRGLATSTCTGRIGHKYRDAIVTNLMGLARNMEYGIIVDALDVRHPFLYRPLIEFALRLPPELCARPQARKWVLREALQGILPDAVRTRVGKGSPAELYAWSLTAQRRLLEPLLRAPILADLGIVDATKLRAAFDTVPCQPSRRNQRHAAVHETLVVEAWLQMRAGRWPRGATTAVLS